MLIVGKKNLEFIKRALLSHEVYCAGKALGSEEDIRKEQWDPELKEIDSMLKAVEINLDQSE